MKKILMLSTALSCLIGFVPSAFAQDTAAPPSADDNSAADDMVGASDIIVTAQKRQESAQKVPISLTAVGAQTITELKIANVTDIASVTSGVNYQPSATGVSPYIRGFGINSGLLGNEPPVTTYVDGVYIPSTSSAIFALSNVERIEVLKGPQGTLYGRNAAAGAVNIVTRTPEQQTSVDVSIGYANYNTISGSLYATTGLTDNLAVDIAAAGSHQNDGWGRNLYNGHDAFLSNNINVRSKLFWTPTDTTTITLQGDYDRTRADPGIALIAIPGTLAPGFAGFPAGGYYDTNDFYDQYRITKQGGGSLRIEQDLPWASITSITSLRSLRTHAIENGTGTPLQVLTYDFNGFQKTFTQELNIQSLPSSNVKWIAGLYYFKDKAGYDPFIQEGTFTRLGATGQILYYGTQKATSYSGYGQVTVPLLDDKLNVTLGLRYTDDTHRLAESYSQTLTSAGVLSDPIFANSPTPKDNKGAFTYKASIDYSPTSTLMFYGSYNRGFKSGYYNIVSNAASAAPPVQAEYIDAYEVGIKSQIFDRKVMLNIAGFYYDVTNLQVKYVGPGGIPVLGNAAAARNKGLDASLDVQLTPQLQLTANVTYADFKYKSYMATFNNYNGGVLGSAYIGDASGNRVIFAEPWSGNIGARYHTDTAIGGVFANVNMSFHSTAYFDAQNLQRRAPYQLLNATVGWTSSDRTWGIDIWGRNLTGEKYSNYGAYTSVSGAYSPGAPLTYGITARFHY